MDTTYENISVLLKDYSIEGNAVKCIFKAPNSDQEVSSIGHMVKSDNEKTRWLKRVKKELLWEARSSAFSLVRDVLGDGTIGRMGRVLVSNSLDGEMLPQYSKSEQKEAILEAFLKVADQFVFDPEKKQWFSTNEVNAFKEFLLQNAISSAYDREILARMLIELSRIDGSVWDSEKDFLQKRLNLSPLQLSELELAGPLSAVAVDETSEQAKPSLYLLSYAIALVDSRLGATEAQQLEKYASYLGISFLDKEKLEKMALENTLHHLFFLNASSEQLSEMAANLNLPLEEVERIYVRWKKRQLE